MHNIYAPRIVRFSPPPRSHCLHGRKNDFCPDVYHGYHQQQRWQLGRFVVSDNVMTSLTRRPNLIRSSETPRSTRIAGKKHRAHVLRNTAERAAARTEISKLFIRFEIPKTAAATRRTPNT